MKIMFRFGFVMLAAVLALGLVTPVLATDAHTATLEGAIGSIVKGMDIPPAVKAHHPDVVTILEIDGVGVLVTRGTSIAFEDEERMKLGAGDQVKVQGEVGAIFAEKVLVDNVEGRFRSDFNGERARLDGTIDEITYPTGVKAALLVDGVHVIVNEDTMIDGKLEVGAGVLVSGKLHALIAREIEVGN